ncbi:Zn-ribbon domain-containing OB-fold protein [Thermodesulfobacteriota bacterium]
MTEKLKPMMEGIFEAGLSPRLLGAICPMCQQKFFPKPMVCPYCLEELQDIKLSSVGKIYTFSVLRTKALYRLPQPYAGGYVDLEDDGLRIYTLFDPEKISDLDFGKTVTLRVGPFGVDNNGEPCLRYYFTTQVGGKE